MANQCFTFVLKTGCRAANIKLELPNNTFWLPDNINVKTYSKSFGCPSQATRGELLVARQEEMVAPGNQLYKTMLTYA